MINECFTVIKVKIECKSKLHQEIFFLVEIILKKQANTPKNREKTGKQDKFEKTGKLSL